MKELEERTRMEPRYFVFDIESVADGRLVSEILYPDDELAPTDAVKRYRAELMERYNNDFIPYTFQIPVSVVIAKVAADFRLEHHPQHLTVSRSEHR